MKNMTLSQIAKACNGDFFPCNTSIEKEVAGVVIDSRKVDKDYLFIATAGERVDGHDYIDAAFARGAIGIICERKPASSNIPYILVKNSFQALKDIAKWYRMQLSIKVVGITGSVGKTSTKEFISSVLSRKYNVLKTEGNFNNEIGLPLTILQIRDYHEVAVLEMGISDFGEMHRLSEIAKPDICVITNIGQCHLENLGSRQGILKAKTEIFDFMSDTGSVCVNGDDDMLTTISRVKGRKPIRFGVTGDNDISATEIKSHGLLGSSCVIHIADPNDTSASKAKDTLPVNIPLPGEHMVLNALAAATVASLLHIQKEEIQTGIASVRPVDGRSNIIRHEQWTVIDDCYNANPVSMKAAIDLLCKSDTKKIAILGDMFELGSNEEELHKEIGRYAVENRVDILICVGRLSRNMYLAAQEVLSQKTSCTSVPQLLFFENRDRLCEALPAILHSNDTILIKASHAMGFEEVVKFLLR